MCAAVTAAGAITAKYADVDSTTLTKTLSGGVWNTNLVISLVTGVASSVVYSVAASPFDTAKLTAVLWLASVLIDLKDASYDIGSLKDSKLQTGVAAVAAVAPTSLCPETPSRGYLVQCLCTCGNPLCCVGLLASCLCQPATYVSRLSLLVPAQNFVWSPSSWH